MRAPIGEVVFPSQFGVPDVAFVPGCRELEEEIIIGWPNPSHDCLAASCVKMRRYKTWLCIALFLDLLVGGFLILSTVAPEWKFRSGELGKGCRPHT